MSGRHLIRGIAQQLARILSADVCHGCGHGIRQGDDFCPACRRRIRRVANPCPACALPNRVNQGVCPACLLNPPRWQRMTAPLQYRGLVREYLIQLKFADALYLGKSLCQQCLDCFAQDYPRPEVLIPVPLHPRRLRERGYNQAYEIARIYSQAFNIPLNRRALSRIRETPSQSGLSAAKRNTNIRNAFRYDSAQAYRHVALVDDIVTTGSTVDEITRLLHRGGVESVEVWALARAYRD